jgi:protein-tyrosine phosphatase
MAEAIMRQMVTRMGLSNQIIVDSAGTHCAQPGATAFIRTLETLAANDVPPPAASRQLELEDLTAFDYVLAMDRPVLTFILRHSSGATAEIRPFLSFAKAEGLTSSEEVPDPFPDGDYKGTYRTIYKGCAALLAYLQRNA